MHANTETVLVLVEEGRLLERKSRHRLSSHPSMTLSRLGYSRHRRRSSCPPRTRQSQAPARDRSPPRTWQSQAPARDRSRLSATVIAGVAPPPQHRARPARPCNCARPPRRAARMQLLNLVLLLEFLLMHILTSYHGDTVELIETKLAHQARATVVRGIS